MAKELLFYITKNERLAMIEGIDMAGYYITKNSRAALVAYATILRSALDRAVLDPEYCYNTVSDILKDVAENFLPLHEDLLERNLIYAKKRKKKEGA